MKKNNYNEDLEKDLLKKMVKLAIQSSQNKTMSMTEIHEISKTLQILDDSYQENPFYKIDSAKYIPYFLEKFNDDELNFVLDILELSRNSIKLADPSLLGIVEAFSTIYYDYNTGKHLIDSSAFQALNIRQDLQNPLFASLFFLCDYLFDTYFHAAQEKAAVYLYDYRFFISPEDGGYVFVENTGNSFSENTLERIQELMICQKVPHYDTMKPYVNQHIEDIQKYGFYIATPDDIDSLSDNMTSDTYFIFCKSLPTIYHKTIQEIQKTFENEIYSFQLPWFPKLSIPSNFSQNSRKFEEKDSFIKYVNCLKEEKKHSEAFTCQFKCSHPNLVMNMLLHRKELSKALNNHITTTRNSQNGVEELYSLFQLLQKNSVSSHDQYLDHLSSYAQNHVEEFPEDIYDKLFESDTDTDSVVLPINLLYAEEATCYNLIANYFASFSILYKQLLMSLKIKTENELNTPNDFSIENDAFLTLYEDKLCNAQKSFFFLMRTFIETQMDIIDVPLLRAFASHNLLLEFSSTPDSLSSNDVLHFLENKHTNSTHTTHQNTLKIFSGLFHVIADENDLIHTRLNKHSPKSSSLLQEAANLQYQLFNYQTLLHTKYPDLPSITDLLNTLPPEHDPRLQNLGRRTRGASDKLNFSRPDKEYDELYQAIRYYVIRNNSYRKKTDDMMSTIRAEMFSFFGNLMK